MPVTSDMSGLLKSAQEGGKADANDRDAKGDPEDVV